MNSYAPRFIDYMEKAGVGYESLPSDLMPVIEKFQNALANWQQADESIQIILHPILIKTDAVISANIYQLFKERVEDATTDKVKLMSLKAKALQLKWKMKKN